MRDYYLVVALCYDCYYKWIEHLLQILGANIADNIDDSLRWSITTVLLSDLDICKGMICLTTGVIDHGVVTSYAGDWGGIMTM